MIAHLVLALVLAADPAPFAWEIPGVVSQVEVPSELVSGGVPVRLRAVTVKGKPDQVAAAIAASFVRQGLWVPASAEFPRGLQEWHVTGFDPRTEKSYTVLFRPHAGGLLTLVLGEAKIGARTPPAAADFAPLFPGAARVMRTSVEGMETVGFYAEADEREVDSFYRATFTSAGYADVGGAWRLRDQQVRVRTHRAAAGLFVMLTRMPVPAE